MEVKNPQAEARRYVPHFQKCFPYLRSIQAKGGNSTIRPVTVKQIINASQVHNDSDFVIDGVDVGSVSYPYAISCVYQLRPF
jgi:hypothetical protein